MPVELREFQSTMEKYDSAISKMKVEMCRQMKGSILTEEEISLFVADYLKPFFEDYWKDNCVEKNNEKKKCKYYECRYSINYCGGHRTVAEKIASIIKDRGVMDILEKVETPVPVKGLFTYYRLRPDAVKKVLSASPLELYNSSVEDFKLYFEFMDDKEKGEIVVSIYNLEEGKRNKEINEWLDGSYPELVEKIGRNLVAEETKCQ